jgi:hypothetical protein
MLRLMFVTTFLLMGISTFAQDSTAVIKLNELEKRNGFKDIKLVMHIDSVKGAKFKKDFKEKKEFDAKLYEVEHPNYDLIGEVKVKKVEIKTYKNLIYEISVVTERDTRLMKALESIYGQSEYDVKNETYLWKGKDLVLKFRSHSKGQLEMVYISYIVHGMMKADKAQKVDDIANDF